MKSTHSLTTVILLLFFITGVYAQSATSLSCYGSDPLLYNGTLYRYYVSPSTTGTQFYDSKEFSEGSVKIRGITFDRLNLNYDVYNQQLVLQFNTPAGGISKIVISDAWLEAFRMNGSDFEVQMVDSVSGIYRAVGQDSLRILYRYTKELVLGSEVSARNMRFTPLINKSYLFDGLKLKRFTGNRTFIRLFPQTEQAELRRFMRKNKINVNKDEDDRIDNLLHYCNSLQL